MDIHCASVGSSMYDTVIRGADVCDVSGISPLDILVRDQKIAALVPRGSAVSANQEIDARGLTVIPGAVDAHVHFRDPGAVHKEGFETGTAAAALGGVTTVVIMPTDIPATASARTVAEKMSNGEGKSHVDFAVTGLLACDLSNLDELLMSGVIGLEMFMTGQDERYRFSDPHLLARALTSLRSVGVPASVSPGDDRIVSRVEAEIMATGRSDPAAFAASRPSLAEASGVWQAALAAAETGTSVHFRQISCQRSMSAIRQWQRAGLKISAETFPHYLFLTVADLSRLGAAAVMSPPLRDDADVEALWQGLADGTISMIATDHAPHLPEEKAVGQQDIWKTPFGVAGLQTSLLLMCDQAVRGRIALHDVVRLCSEAPARLFGMFPRKGCLKIGADADIVGLDLGAATTITNEAQASKARATPFHGRTVNCGITFTMLRGQLIVREGALVNRLAGECVPGPGL